MQYTNISYAGPPGIVNAGTGIDEDGNSIYNLPCNLANFFTEGGDIASRSSYGNEIKDGTVLLVSCKPGYAAFEEGTDNSKNIENVYADYEIICDNGLLREKEGKSKSCKKYCVITKYQDMSDISIEDIDEGLSNSSNYMIEGKVRKVTCNGNNGIPQSGQNFFYLGCTEEGKVVFYHTKDINENRITNMPKCVSLYKSCNTKDIDFQSPYLGSGKHGKAYKSRSASRIQSNYFSITERLEYNKDSEWYGTNGACLSNINVDRIYSRCSGTYDWGENDIYQYAILHNTNIKVRLNAMILFKNIDGDEADPFGKQLGNMAEDEQEQLLKEMEKGNSIDYTLYSDIMENENNEMIKYGFGTSKVDRISNKEFDVYCYNGQWRYKNSNITSSNPLKI